MNRLNGWQRLWIVLMALWAVVVFGFAYATLPGAVYHSDNQKHPDVVARMGTQTWKGDDCGRNYELTLDDGRTWTVDASGESLASHIRRKFPKQYDDLSDAELEARFRKKYGDGKDNPVSMSLTQLKELMRRMTDAGESNENLETVVRYYAAQQIVRVNFPTLSGQPVLCFDKSIAKTEMERISHDYERAHGSLVAAQRRRLLVGAFPFWFTPGVVVYAVGLGVGWIRRGFAQS